MGRKFRPTPKVLRSGTKVCDGDSQSPSGESPEESPADGLVFLAVLGFLAFLSPLQKFEAEFLRKLSRLIKSRFC